MREVSNLLSLFRDRTSIPALERLPRCTSDFFSVPLIPERRRAGIVVDHPTLGANNHQRASEGIDHP